MKTPEWMHKVNVKSNKTNYMKAYRALDALTNKINNIDDFELKLIISNEVKRYTIRAKEILTAAPSFCKTEEDLNDIYEHIINQCNDVGKSVDKYIKKQERKK